MKHIEIESTWNIFLEIISGLSHEIDFISSADACRVDIEEACKNLACYSVSKDMGHGVKTKRELVEMEESGLIVNSHIFIRLTRHFYLLGVIEKKDTKWLCDLLETIHDYLGNQYSYSNETDQALFNLLERKIATVGGNTVYKAIMEKYVARWYFSSMDRYLYGRTIDQERNAPFNLLLQISAKHLRQGRDLQITKDITEYMNEIITLAEAILDICDVQGTSGIEYGMMKPELFPLFLINEMVFDKICVAQQYSARYILLSLDYLIKPWFDYAKRNYSYEDYYKVAD